MSNAGSIAALSTMLYACFIKITQVCKNPGFCWAWNYFKAIYCLTTNLSIHSSAGRALCQLDFEVPLMHIKTHQDSKWEKKNASKEWLPFEFRPFGSVASSSILAPHGRVVPQNKKYLCFSFKIIGSSGFVIQQASYHHHSSFPHMQKCFMVQLCWPTRDLKPLALVQICNQTVLTLRRFTPWPQKLHLNYI